MGQAPSQPGPPGTKFRVIGAGMTLRSRTGTKTLNEALSILLDGPVHDSGIQSLGGPPDHQQKWSFADEKKLDWLLSSVLEGYVATMDCPAATLTPELMRVYPDALVLCTTRSQDSWWRSMEYLNGMMGTWWLPLVVLWLRKSQIYGVWRVRFQQVMIWRYGDDRILEGTKQKHEDHLRAVVPPEKLFWYNVSEGWEPLCNILGVPVPDQPFPHNNNKSDARKVYQEHIVAGLASWVFMLAIVTMVIYYSSSWMKRWAV
ncbi:hypothetical protein PG996_014378 [Apiospora saccharicola]|uniref:NAD dependent epimerase/dehydratase n=1 Tax=Apiospora saccharicola TaxID=335842 RepID=A0ABR1TI63_9PEZI